MLDDYFAERERQWDSLCRHCGACCGVYDDPCKHLKGDSVGRYYCEIYPQRFGVRQTRNGEKFNCVSIKTILHTTWKNDWQCAYKSIPAFHE